VLQLVERKVEGKEVVIAEAPQSKAQVIDLMEALRQSLGKSRRAETAQDEGKKPARAKAAEPSSRRAGSEATAPKPPARAMRDAAAEAKPAKRSRAAK
jgi:DNA end-binding protein Ku